ncbi:Hypothetical protein MVR_LOCUS119 [uncultured virus]|nr:Hypothetical protein MVR_LOCUS119 [uncultured virus]
MLPSIFESKQISGPINIMRLANTSTSSSTSTPQLKTIYIYIDASYNYNQSRCSDIFSLPIDNYLINQFTKYSSQDRPFKLDFITSMSQSTNQSQSHPSLYDSRISVLLDRLLVYDPNNKDKVIVDSDHFSQVRFHYVPLLKPIRHDVGFSTAIRDDPMYSKLLKSTYYSSSQVHAQFTSIYQDTIKPMITKFEQLEAAQPEQDELTISPTLLQRLKLNDVGLGNVYSSQLEKHEYDMRTLAHNIRAALSSLYCVRRIIDKDYIKTAVLYINDVAATYMVDVLCKNFGFRVTHDAKANKPIDQVNQDVIAASSMYDQYTNVVPDVLYQCCDVGMFPELFE